MKPALKLYVYAVIAAGGLALALGLRAAPFQPSQHAGVLMVLLATLTALTYLAPVKLAAKRSLVMHIALQTVAILTLRPGLAGAVLALGVLAGNAYLGRRWFNILFNAAQTGLAVLAAGAVYSALTDVSLAQPGRDLTSIAALIPAGAVLYFVSSLAADFAAAIQRGRSPFSNWTAMHGPDLAAHVALVAVGAATAATVNRAPWSLLVAVVPVVAIRASLRSAMGFDDEMVRIIELIVDAAEARHPYLAGSSRRVSELAQAVARIRGMSETDRRRVGLAARLHDVAMTVLPDFVGLAGPDACDEHERFFWSTHCTVGADLVARVLRLPHLADGIAYHHERIDGAGYPHGLRGLDIPLDARIVSACEAWVALTSQRGYRPALNEEQALSILHAGAGRQWDASVVGDVSGIVRPAPVPASRRADARPWMQVAALAASRVG